MRHTREVGDSTLRLLRPSRPASVLDPFMGTGTTALVAERLRRDWLGVELNPAYAKVAKRRITVGGRREPVDGWHGERKGVHAFLLAATTIHYPKEVLGHE